MHRRLLAACVVLSLVAGSFPGGTAAARPDAPPAAPEDPATDVVGWENGYWYNESVAVDQSDGLDARERRAFVARSMARVEVLRNAEFESSVPVEVVSRSEYANRSRGNVSPAYSAWNNQVWEAMFVSGEDSNVTEQLDSTLTSSVAGFYSPADDEIKIVTDSPERPVISNATLIHELTHALQDQRYNLSSSRYRRQTQDGELAVDGAVEGEANYIEDLYLQRCRTDWECVSTPTQGGGSSGTAPDYGILFTVLQPYSDGPAYVHALYERGGWDAVEAAMRNPPESTEQVIHVTDEKPRPIDYEDRARDGWETFPNQGQNGSDTLGEASIYVMFWDQARTAGADTVPVGSIRNADGPYDSYNYAADPSAGWANDRVFPYRKETPNGTDYGYVWVTEWDTERDATQFRRAYLEILRAHDVRVREDGVHVVDDGRFADAFLVSRNGTRVTVVNGPTPADARDIRPEVEADETTDATGLGAPGFGLLAAIAALGAFVLFARAR